MRASRAPSSMLPGSFHTNIFPNFTVVNIEKPPCFLRKFFTWWTALHSLFSRSDFHLKSMNFRVLQLAEDLLRGHARWMSLAIWKTLPASAVSFFNRFFWLKHTTSVASNGEHLNRECSLFTDDGKYVIVGSAMYIQDDPYPYFFDMYRNNESVSPNSRSPLEDYTLHLVDLDTGRLCDHRSFKCDKIFLLAQPRVCISTGEPWRCFLCSSRRSTSSKSPKMAASLMCDLLDASVMRMTSLLLLPLGTALLHQRDLTMSHSSISLKHRLMVFLYKRAQYERLEYGTPRPLLKFYQHFDQFCALRMWKMQLLDENHLLIKYANEDMVTLKIQDPNSQPSFFVVYNMVTTEVLGVYENTSEELLDLFENFCDMFSQCHAALWGTVHLLYLQQLVCAAHTPALQADYH